MDETEDVLEELATLPTLAHPTASPDGDAVAFYYDDTGRNEIHVLDIETGSRDIWSDGEVPRDARWYIEWAADGNRVFFHRDEGGNEQNDIYAIGSDGTVEPALEMDGQSYIHNVSEDVLLVGSNRDGQLNSYRHDLSTGETTKLTDYDRAVWQTLLSPDGSQIAYSTNETDDFDNRDVYVANADGSAPRKLEIGDVGGESAPVEWGPEGRRLLVADNSEDMGRVGVYEVETDEISWYGSDAYDEDPQCWLPDGNRVVATRMRDALTVPVVYDLTTGEGRELELPDGVATFGMGGEPVLGPDKLLFTHTTPTRRPELLSYDLEADESEILVKAEHGSFEPEDFADAKYNTVTSDGVPDTPQAAIEHDPAEEREIGYLLYDSGERPSPLVVKPHGGPRSRDSKAFDLYTQVLAARGFSVLEVNYRGSTGHGREFAEALIDDWGGTEQGDVVTVAEHVLETNDWLDEETVVVFGGSYGGYSAYWQLVQYPTLYAAGIAWIGLTDLEDMYENTMAHYRVELMEKYLGTPTENPELYRNRSPVTHVENVAAPLLIVHGVNDRRVPISQARIFRDAVEDAGYVGSEAAESGEVDFEYRELGEEGHASSDQQQKLRMFRLLDDFLSRHAGAKIPDN